MVEIIAVLLFVLFCFGFREWLKWHLSDDRQLPLSSYWKKEQLDSAFTRSPLDRKKFEARGSMSRKEWYELMGRRDREVVAELKRRGVDPESSLKK